VEQIQCRQLCAIMIFWLQPNTSEILYIDEKIKKCSKNLLSVSLIICIWIQFIAIIDCQAKMTNVKKREMRIELPWPWLSTVHGISSFNTLNPH